MQSHQKKIQDNSGYEILTIFSARWRTPRPKDCVALDNALQVRYTKDSSASSYAHADGPEETIICEDPSSTEYLSTSSG